MMSYTTSMKIVFKHLAALLFVWGLINFTFAIPAFAQQVCLEGDCENGYGVRKDSDGRKIMGYFYDGELEGQYMIEDEDGIHKIDEGFLGISFSMSYINNSLDNFMIRYENRDIEWEGWVFEAGVHKYVLPKSSTVQEPVMTRRHIDDLARITASFNDMFFDPSIRYFHGFFTLDEDTDELVRYDTYGFPGWKISTRQIRIPFSELKMVPDDSPTFFGGENYKLQCKSGNDCIKYGIYNHDNERWEYRAEPKVRFIGAAGGSSEYFKRITDHVADVMKYR